MSSPIGDINQAPAASAASPKREQASRVLPLAPEKSSAPAAPAPAPAPSAEPGSAALQRAVEELNRHFNAQRNDLKFSVEKDLDVIVVAVVDSKDGTVLRQIPSADALRIARALHDAHGGLIEAVA